MKESIPLDTYIVLIPLVLILFKISGFCKTFTVTDKKGNKFNTFPNEWLKSVRKV